MDNLQIFKGHKVEIIEYENKILFNPYDVGACLELEKSTIRRAIQGMNDKQAIKLTNSAVQNMNTRKLNNFGENFLTESGVYKLIFKSNKPKAEEFANWVTDEVLPTLRKTGTYTLSNQNNQTIDLLVNTQQNMLIMINTLATTVENLVKQSQNKQDIRIKEDSEIEKLKKEQSNIQNLKVLSLPQDIINIIDELLLSKNRNFSYISRYLYSKGYQVSNVAVSKYYHKILKGEH